MCLCAAARNHDAPGAPAGYLIVSGGGSNFIWEYFICRVRPILSASLRWLRLIYSLATYAADLLRAGTGRFYHISKRILGISCAPFSLHTHVAPVSVAQFL